MKMTFRWYGDSDPVTLRNISQIPAMDGIVSAVYDVAPGGVWSRESIAKIKNNAQKNNLTFEVVESVPVHEDIKLGKPSRDQYIQAYAENIRRLGEAGVKVICYNFMPVFDWLRSELDFENTDGSTSLVYRAEQVLQMDPASGTLSLPGWDSSYKKEDLLNLLQEYKDIDGEKLFANLKYFLDKIIPVCEEYDVNMAIHPDDPPWDIFGLPRIITNEANIDKFLALNPSPRNGLTFCTGSLGAGSFNDIPRLLRKYSAMGRVHFVHARNVKHCGDRDFDETAHPSKYGSLDMYQILKALHDTGFCGYIRPDHGRMIWGETGKPGYGLYDRALGAVYLYGLWEGICKQSASDS